ncbi:MAG: SPOR domain-containing protein [Bacteriovoracaceae bacterium]
MENNNKLFVLDKKEIALIFLFMIVIAITSFTLGVRIGKKMLLTSQGITAADMDAFKLKSQTEEQVEKAKNEIDGKPVDKEEVNKDGFNNLQKEMETIESSDIGATAKSSKGQTEEMTSSGKEDVMMSSADEETATGKFTIQLGSYPKLSEAKEFADAFTVRGYNPLINQVKINEKNWYRVSLGSFGSMAEAKEYVKKEESLFQGQDFVIVEIK